jgi:predicted RNA-binding protein YlqC (UPF0109 family)
LKEFLEFVLRNLVEFPDEVIVTQGEDGAFTFFKVSLNKSDVGRVVGKSGHTIAAIRNLLSTSAARHNRKVSVEILDGEEF